MGKYTDIFRNLIHNSNAMKKPFEKYYEWLSYFCQCQRQKVF